MKTCTTCQQPCEVVELHWKEREEYWGAVAWRDCYEDVSECCNAEIVEGEDEQEGVGILLPDYRTGPPVATTGH